MIAPPRRQVYQLEIAIVLMRLRLPGILPERSSFEEPAMLTFIFYCQVETQFYTLISTLPFRRRVGKMISGDLAGKNRGIFWRKSVH